MASSGHQERRLAREPIGGTSIGGVGRRPIVQRPAVGTARQGAQGRSGDSANRGASEGGFFRKLIVGQPGTPGGKRDK